MTIVTKLTLGYHHFACVTTKDSSTISLHELDHKANLGKEIARYYPQTYEWVSIYGHDKQLTENGVRFFPKTLCDPQLRLLEKKFADLGINTPHQAIAKTKEFVLEVAAKHYHDTHSLPAPEIDISRAITQAQNENIPLELVIDRLLGH